MTVELSQDQDRDQRPPVSAARRRANSDNPSRHRCSTFRLETLNTFETEQAEIHYAEMEESYRPRTARQRRLLRQAALAEYRMERAQQLAGLLEEVLSGRDRDAFYIDRTAAAAALAEQLRRFPIR